MPHSNSIFLSHASEDKDAIARPLAEELRHRGMDVWFDEFSLTVGSSLRREIDKGLALARFGVVILSASFFEKEWAQRELDALTARETGEAIGLILPVWHEIDRATVARFSPTLADRVAVHSSLGVSVVADHIVKAVQRTPEVLTAEPREREIDEGDLTDKRREEKRHPTRSQLAPRFEWHPDIHIGWGQAELTFVQLSFSPRYDRNLIFASIARVINTLGAQSWLLDEVFGGHDVLLRLWLPRYARESLLPLLDEELAAADLRTTAIFKVTEIMRHWIWQSPTGRGIRYPSPTILRAGMSGKEIHALQNGQLSVGKTNELIEENVIAPVGSSLGIRFYVGVKLSTHDLPAQEEFGKVLVSVIDDATGINEPAIYRGQGFADFLITGKVTSDQFDRLTLDLIEPINGVVGLYDARSYTTLASSPELSFHAEYLSEQSR